MGIWNVKLTVGETPLRSLITPHGDLELCLNGVMVTNR